MHLHKYCSIELIRITWMGRKTSPIQQKPLHRRHLSYRPIDSIGGTMCNILIGLQFAIPSGPLQWRDGWSIILKSILVLLITDIHPPTHKYVKQVHRE